MPTIVRLPGAGKGVSTTPFAMSGGVSSLAAVMAELGLSPKCGAADAFSDAALKGRADLIQALKELGCDINATDGSCEQTALHTAVRHLELDAVKLLLAYGADPSICDRDALTPEAWFIANRSADDPHFIEIQAVLHAAVISPIPS